MKKVALSLLALALVGSMAFGQDAPALKIGGYLDTGTTTTMYADTGNSTVIKGDDSGVGGGSFALKLSYGTDKAGFKGNYRIENVIPGAGSTINPLISYVWFLVPGAEAVKILGGNYDDDGTPWNQVDDNGAKQTKGTGVAIVATPSEGFSLGGAVAPQGSKNGLFSAGATYSVPGTVQVVAAALTGYNKDDAIALDNAGVSFKLLMDGPLSLKGGADFSGLAAEKATGAQIYDVTVGYKVTDAFSVNANIYAFTWGADLKAVDISKGTAGSGDAAALSYKVNPSISYTIDPVFSVGFGGTYQSGGSAIGALVSDGAKAVKFGNTSVVVPAGTYLYNKVTKIEINPNATVTLDPNAKVVLNYKYDALSGDDTKNGKDLTWSTIIVDFRYSF
jgi:hypothetical protein